LGGGGIGQRGFLGAAVENQEKVMKSERRWKGETDEKFSDVSCRKQNETGECSYPRNPARYLITRNTVEYGSLRQS
jgi:hypothetical protein